MPPSSTADFQALLLSSTTRVVGLDVGERRTGLALSDLRHPLAVPWQLVAHPSLMEGVAPVASWIKTEEVAGLIIGWPVEMSGKVGSQCQKVLQFAEALSARVEKPFFLWDERLSTAATARSLKDVPLSRKKYAATLDKATAAHILQGALEFFRRRG